MTENYEHYITRNIKAFYRKRLSPPILYLLIMAALWFVFPLKMLLFPPLLSPVESFQESYERKDRYASATFRNLTFTGYTGKRYNNTIGYYYYTFWKDECVIVLLSPSTCEQGNPRIEEVSVRGQLQKADNSYQVLLTAIAGDLEWTQAGILTEMPGYYFSEPDYHPILTRMLFIVYFGTVLYSVIVVIIYLIYTRFPVLAPACQNLVVFGSPKKMLAEAEQELATLPQLATEDMFITEHYFIMTSPLGNAIVPIREILWIYKHSTLHKFLWYHFSISYTMHIVANKHLYVHCPKNIKSDIDGIMDYLAEANHNISVGFSEENRLKTEAVLGKPFHIEKFYALMRRRI